MSLEESLIEDYNKCRGQFVITSTWEVKRLIGLLDEVDEDHFWIYYDGKDIEYHSVLCGFTPLKGKIDDKDYDDFIRLAKLNHYDVYDKASESDHNEHKQDILNKIIKHDSHKLICGLDWGL